MANAREDNTTWYILPNLNIHTDLYEKGIIAITNVDNDKCPALAITANQFEFNGRQFLFYRRDSNDNNEESTTKIKKNAQNSHVLLKLICQHSALLSNEEMFIYNPNRREEIYLPLFLDDGEEIGFYVEPWLSKKSKQKTFAGFDQFVVAGCMFGSFLQGRDQQQGMHTLLDHHIHLADGLQIESVLCTNEQFSAFEQMQFKQFSCLSKFMPKLAKANALPKVIYHLPYYDYILFALRLLIEGKMTDTAFNEFCKVTLKRKVLHETEIQKIFAHSQLTITSPFDNLFGKLYSKENFAEEILKILGIDITTKISEKLVIETCIELLLKNEHDKAHQQIWHDLFNVIDKNEIKSIEALLKIANTMVLAIASRNKKDYATCSLLPLSEKQIQLAYATYNKRLKYPEIVNFTFLDSIFAYSITSNDSSGRLFYFDENKLGNTLSALINKDNLLQTAYRNISFFAKNQRDKTIPIRAVCKDQENENNVKHAS